MRRFLWSIIFGLLLTIAWLEFSFQESGHFLRLVAIAPAVNNLKLPGLSFGTLTRPTTVLFMGTDVVYDGKGRSLKADRSALNGRSDTMMLVFINPLHNKISVLHIPRDTEVSIGRYGIQKINIANALGGPEFARVVVTGMLDVPVDHYVVMNISGLVDLVNEVGGVTVEVPKRMSYMDWTGKLKIDLTPGVHTLTGNQAMGFVRFRHDELGDIGRVQRQQLFLQAVSRKMLDPGAWMHVPALVGIAQKCIQTDMSEVDIFEALNFARTVPKDNIKFVMLPGDFSGNGNWIAAADVRALAAHLANPDQEVVASRRNISVYVVNASSDPGFGNKLAKALRKLGYITSVCRDEKESISPRTRIITQNGNVAEARMIQQDLGNAGEVVNASVGVLNSSITIIARDDIILDKITMSSVDAPYVAPVASARQIVNNSSAGTHQEPDQVPQTDTPVDGVLGEQPASADTLNSGPAQAEIGHSSGSVSGRVEERPAGDAAPQSSAAQAPAAPMPESETQSSVPQTAPDSAPERQLP